MAECDASDVSAAAPEGETALDPLTRWANTRHIVYFIQRGGEGGPIKIGYTKQRLRDRLVTLRSSLRCTDGSVDPLRPLLIVPGGRGSERRLHHRFKSLCIRGEWFRAEPELLQFIEMGKGDPSRLFEAVEATPIPGFPWRTALAARIEDECRRHGRSPSVPGVPESFKELRNLRLGEPMSLRTIELFAAFVECELVLVPRDRVADVGRLLEGTKS